MEDIDSFPYAQFLEGIYKYDKHERQPLVLTFNMVRALESVDCVPSSSSQTLTICDQPTAYSTFTTLREETSVLEYLNLLQIVHSKCWLFDYVLTKIRP